MQFLAEAVFILIISYVQCEILVIHEAENCPEINNKETPLGVDFTYDFYNSTTKSANALVNLKREFGKEYTMRLILFKFLPSGSWSKPLVSFSEKGGCLVAQKYLSSFFVALAKEAGVKEPEKCPIPPGVYKIDNYVPAADLKVNLPGFHGKYKIIISAEREKMVDFCGIGVFSLLKN